NLRWTRPVYGWLWVCELGQWCGIAAAIRPGSGTRDVLRIVIPLLAEEGRPRHNKISRSHLIGADGVVSSAKTRPCGSDHFIVSRYRARASRPPVCAAEMASHHLFSGAASLEASPCRARASHPPLRRGECTTALSFPLSRKLIDLHRTGCSPPQAPADASPNSDGPATDIWRVPSARPLMRWRRDSSSRMRNPPRHPRAVLVSSRSSSKTAVRSYQSHGPLHEQGGPEFHHLHNCRKHS